MKCYIINNRNIKKSSSITSYSFHSFFMFCSWQERVSKRSCFILIFNRPRKLQSLHPWYSFYYLFLITVRIILPSPYVHSIDIYHVMAITIFSSYFNRNRIKLFIMNAMPDNHSKITNFEKRYSQKTLHTLRLFGRRVSCWEILLERDWFASPLLLPFARASISIASSTKSSNVSSCLRNTVCHLFRLA